MALWVKISLFKDGECLEMQLFTLPINGLLLLLQSLIICDWCHILINWCPTWRKEKSQLPLSLFLLISTLPSRSRPLRSIRIRMLPFFIILPAAGSIIPGWAYHLSRTIFPSSFLTMIDLWEPLHNYVVLLHQHRAGVLTFAQSHKA